MNIKILLVCLLIFFTLHAGAQSFDKAKLDTYFDAVEKSGKFMGNVALSEKGSVIYARAVGFSDIEANKKADTNTIYRIGSISKTFTATLIFKAIEDGKLSLDTKLSKFYPTIKNAAQITVEMLLGHRSGIHNFTNDSAYLTYNEKAKTEAEMIQIIDHRGSDFVPDARAEYSNSNFVLLSYILQTVFKKPYAELLDLMIVKPVGLKHTYFGGRINLNKDESQSNKRKGNWTKEGETDMTIPMGAGGIVSTASDLIQFASALFTGKIISNSHVDMMIESRDNFGLGLFEIPFNEKIGHGHTGGIDGFTSVFGYFDDEKTGFALVSNGTTYDINKIVIAMLSAAFNTAYSIPDFKPSTMTAADLTPFIGLYASKDIPLKITISTVENALMAQATGQPAFELEPVGKNTFKFEAAGIVIEFAPEEKQFKLMQGGGVYLFGIEK